MTRAWKPGDVAMVELPQGGERPSVLVGHDPSARCWHSTYDNGDLRCYDADAVTARPLVVIDPEDEKAVERLVSLYCSEDAGRQLGTVEALTWALREFADPKPKSCSAVLYIGGERIECERDGDAHSSDHRNDCIGQGVRWSK